MKETAASLGRVALRWALWSPRRVVAVGVAAVVLLGIVGGTTKTVGGLLGG